MSDYKQSSYGAERDQIVKEWYENLPDDEKTVVTREMRKLSSGLRNMDVLGMLWLIVALDCAGATKLLLGGENVI